ncbi:GNAT family N-acetyltransferase [Streptomyces subrutilus]|uniref:GNAT family N-acetyltransferase n=1 Tax=Streptomyces subrutilus TaxID=36818 RepID=UPI0033FD54D4
MDSSVRRSGSGEVGAGLMIAFMSFVFSDDRTRRVVAEPDARDEKGIAQLQRTGFVLGPEVELPEIDLPEVHLPAKRARLASSTRRCRCRCPKTTDGGGPPGRALG